MKPSLYLSENCVVVTVSSTILAASTNRGTVEVINLSEAKPQDNNDNQRVAFTPVNRVEGDHCSSTDIICGSVSKCGKWFAVCTGDKKLYQWLTDSWILSSVRKVNRIASSVKFTPSGQGIVIADKSGDAYLYSVHNCTEDGQLLLGHLSMLLDVVVSPCEKFVITCDRDEKIRVSRFPNAYNIQSYCLGHEDFVSTIDFLPSDANVMISGSGDGSVRFWDYLEGKQIGIIHCDTDALLEQRRDNNGNESDVLKEALAVTRFSQSKTDNGVNVLAVNLSSFKGCVLYHISGDKTGIHSVVFNILNLDVEPWDILCCRNKELWSLAAVEKCPVAVHFYNDSTSEILLCDDSVHCKSKSLANSFHSKWALFSNIPTPKLEPIMHKRRESDLQEYQMRKRLRLANKSS